MKLRDIIREINTMIDRFNLITVRQAYYQLYLAYFSQFKTVKSFYNSFDKKLVIARERDLVDPDKIIDTVRQTLGGDNGFLDAETYQKFRLEQFLKSPEHYQRHMWIRQKVIPIIWIEKDALSRVVKSVADEYRVEVCPSRGYSSLPYLRNKFMSTDKEAELRGIVQSSDKIKLFHYVDHDPSGINMTEDLRKRAERYAGRPVSVTRIALNIDQVNKYNLIPSPTKKADSRAKKYRGLYGDNCWELDALPPDVLKLLVSQSIESCIDSHLWNIDIDKENAERESLKRVFEEYARRMKGEVK